MRRVKILICLFFALGGLAHAFSGGPIPGRTGAPGEATCVDCHDEFELNRGGGRVEILDLPKNYSTNQRITMRVRVAQARQKRWGFQITAIDAKGNGVGQFAITDVAATQIINGDGRSYVEHTSQGTRAGQMNSAEWTFDWIAPSFDAGPVTFYAAGNAANGNNDILGDFIYTTLAPMGGPSDPLVTLTTPNGGETLTTGKPFTITWNSTNASAHDLLFQLNGTGDVPRVIVSGLSGDAREFTWNVPSGFATMRGRVIVVAQGREGRADSDVSDRDFTIVAGQQIPGPTITTIKVTNKKIKITGSGLSADTRVTVNGVGFMVAPKLNAGGELIQKGEATNGLTIGQLIPSGARVRFAFINSNGGVTEVDFTRP